MSLAQQRLAPGQAHFFDTQGHEDPDDPQIVFHGQFGKLSALGAGAAVDAFIIAAVGDGNTKIA